MRKFSLVIYQFVTHQDEQKSSLGDHTSLPQVSTLNLCHAHLDQLPWNCGCEGCKVYCAPLFQGHREVSRVFGHPRELQGRRRRAQQDFILEASRMALFIASAQGRLHSEEDASSPCVGEGGHTSALSSLSCRWDPCFMGNGVCLSTLEGTTPKAYPAVWKTTTTTKHQNVCFHIYSIRTSSRI